MLHILFQINSFITFSFILFVSVLPGGVNLLFSQTKCVPEQLEFHLESSSEGQILLDDGGIQQEINYELEINLFCRGNLTLNTGSIAEYNIQLLENSFIRFKVNAKHSQGLSQKTLDWVDSLKFGTNFNPPGFIQYNTDNGYISKIEISLTDYFVDGNSPNIYKLEYFIGGATLENIIRVKIDLPEPWNFYDDNFDLIGSPILTEGCGKPPVAQLNFEPQLLIVGEEIIFDGLDSKDEDGQIVLYEWDLGDSQKAEGDLVQHTYQNTGKYMVSLKVTDDKGLSNTQQKEVFVFPFYKLSFYSQLLNNNRFDSNPILIASAEAGGNGIQPIKVCADGSLNTTLLSIVKKISTSGESDFSALQINIQEDPENQKPHLFGEFKRKEGVFSRDSVVFYYEHPIKVEEKKMFHTITLKIEDEIDGQKFSIPYPIEIYRAPVVMIHGLWANKTTFDKMEENLSSLWPKAGLFSMEYGPSAAKHFHENKNIPINAIDHVFSELIKAGYSCGKVNVVAHSMGGILTRNYLQSEEYRNDIFRLITLNTPHSGSQMANFLLEDFLSFAPLFEEIFTNYNKNPLEGAVNDLRIDSDAILNHLNHVERLNLNTVPTHAIFTHTKFRNISGWKGLLYELVRIYFDIRGIGDLDNLINDIFSNEKHDLIVALSSQKGGLPSFALTEFPNQWHGSTDNENVISHVETLLNSDPEGLNFSMNGYSSKILSYDLMPLTVAKLIPTITPKYKIQGPIRGKKYRPKENLKLTLEKLEDININANSKKIREKSTLLNEPEHFLLLIGSQNQEIMYYSWEEENWETGYEIPNDLVGRLKFFLFAFYKDGTYSLDSTSVFVEPSATLDSMSTMIPRLQVNQNGVAPLIIYGHYSDGFVRDITYVDSLIFHSTSDTILNIENNGVIRGNLPGKASIIVQYADKSTQVEVEVILDTITTVSSTPEVKKIFQDLLVFPNPIQGNTTFKYRLPEVGRVKLSLSDLKGKEIKILVDEIQIPGNHQIDWFGENENGTEVSKGVYLYYFQYHERLEVGKVLKK